MIIDVHSHMGYDEIFEHDFPAEDLLWAQERNGVDITIVQPGSCVLLAWGAANRDPRQYEDPDVFRADRNPAGHLAFGSGIHSCPGTRLARMEGQAVLREIVTNIERIEVVEPPTWTTNANLLGLNRLRVSVTPRATAPSLCHKR